jgi:hypothetical protein
MPNYMENIFWKFFRRIWGGIETADNFGLIFPMEKREESGSIHPPTLLQLTLHAQ